MSDNISAPLTLKILTPEGEQPEIKCDSIIITVQDNEKGKGGGSYGIRKGHAEALIATADGNVTARLGETEVFSSHLKSGFATVKNNIITIIAE